MSDTAAIIFHSVTIKHSRTGVSIFMRGVQGWGRAGGAAGFLWLVDHPPLKHGVNERADVGLSPEKQTEEPEESVRLCLHP